MLFSLPHSLYTATPLPEPSAPTLAEDDPPPEPSALTLAEDDPPPEPSAPTLAVDDPPSYDIAISYPSVPT